MQALTAFSKQLSPRGYAQPIAPFKINWKHPLALGLIGFFPVGQAPINLVGGGPLLLNGGVSPTRTSQVYGPAVTFGGAVTAGLDSGYSTVDTIIARSGGVYWSIASLCLITTGAGTTGGAPMYGERGSSGNDIIKLCFNHLTSNRVEITLRNDGGTLVQVASNNQNDGLYHHWVATKNGNGGSGNVILYKDAVSIATGNWTGADNYTDASLRGVIGATDNTDTTGSFPGSIVYSAVWRRVLTPDEVKFLYLNPFCLLTSEEMPTLSSGSSALFPFYKLHAIPDGVFRGLHSIDHGA